MGEASIEVDTKLIDKAMRLTGAPTKRDVVRIALRSLIERCSLYRTLRQLRGQLAWEGSVTASRSARTTRS